MDEYRKRISLRIMSGLMAALFMAGSVSVNVLASEDLAPETALEEIKVEAGDAGAQDLAEQEADAEEPEVLDLQGDEEDQGELQNASGEPAEGTEGDTTGTYFDVTDFGANGNDKKDDYVAINAALAMANTTDQPITVYIPDGKYYLSRSLYIFSNTTLKLGPNAFIYEMSTFERGVMIIGTHLKSDGEICVCCVGQEGVVCDGYGYSKCHDITIDGGTWVAYKNPKTGYCPGSQIVGIRHAHDITIKNMTCKNASGHSVNLSGVDTATVSNVTFDTSNPNKGETADILVTREFIHLDYCNELGEPAYGVPYDNTPSKNITVENCTFTNGYSGVGNHHELPRGGEISSNIVVRGCTFNKMKSYAVGEYSVDGLTVENCNAKDCLTLALISDSKNINLVKNTYDAVRKHEYDDVLKDCGGIKMTASDNVTIDRNNISNATNSGISVTNSTNVDILGNTCKKAKKDGIVVKSVKNGTIDSNKVKNAKKYGIEYRSTLGMTLSKNNVTSTDSALYIIGTKKAKSKGNFTDNTLNSKKKYDLYLGRYANNCYFSGNVLKNYTFLGISKKYKGTIDLPKIDKIILKKYTYEFTGKKIKPKAVVKDSMGNTLKKGKDYEIYYKKPIGPGTASIIVEGKSRTIFQGQKLSITYKIIYTGDD